MTIQIHLTEQQLALFNEQALQNSLSLEEAAKAFFLEQLEDLEDWKAYEEAKKEYENDPVTYTHDEALKMLGLA